MKTTQPNLAALTLSCLFAALISVGAYIAIPIPGTPVPIVLQNMFIILAPLVLGPKWGMVSVAVYLGLGAAGLPVFSGGTGGLARFFGPTGGYLVAYLPCAVIVGLVSRSGKRAIWKDALGAVLGMAVVYAIGVVWLKGAIKGTWAKAIAAGVLPFLPGDALKIAAAALLASRLAPIADKAMKRKAEFDEGEKESGT